MSLCKRISMIMVLVLFLILCMPASPALAASATSVLVNGVTLTSAAPYWANGSSAASATKPLSGGYLYFDATGPTLTFYNASVNTLSLVPSTTIRCFVYANGDVNVVLSGTSSLSYTSGSTVYPTIYGLQSAGTMTISGEGSLSVSINNASATSINRAIYSSGDLTVLSGTLSIYAGNGTIGYGMHSLSNILIAGGSVRITTYASLAFGMYAAGDIRITGGSITASSESYNLQSVGMYGQSIYLEGGSGSFWSKGGGISCGLGFVGAELTYSGGVFRFSGETSGIIYDHHTKTYTLRAIPGSVYTSLNLDGSNKRLWLSDADGLLISLFTNIYSDFKYVQFGADGIPQTGDDATPWLWAGWALCAAAGAGWLTARRKGRIYWN